MVARPGIPRKKVTLAADKRPDKGKHNREWKPMRAKVTMLLSAAALLALAVPGLAESAPAETLDPADRALIHSYDPAAMQLLWATVLDTEAEDACTVTPGEDYEYRIDEEGNVEVDGTEGDCSFNATEVTGPNGQVNHGSVVSSFVKALKESGYEGNRGCLIRIIAGSDYGKGDQQVKANTEEDGADEDGAEVEDPGAIESSAQFEITETTCKKGKPDDAGKPDRPEKAKGKPEWAGQPDHPDHPGKGNGPKDKTDR